jgi:hypothetical protein
MAILSTLLTSTAAPISPDLAGDTAITVMLFCNLNLPGLEDSTLGKQYLDIHVVADGAAVSNTNKIVNQVPIDAGDTLILSNERIVLGPGDRVYAKTTDTNEVSVTITYVVI